jgi:hypothetical protein
MSGTYVFDGYEDGAGNEPLAVEQVIPLAKGSLFPWIKSSRKGCWWMLVRWLEDPSRRAVP